VCVWERERDRKRSCVIGCVVMNWDCNSHLTRSVGVQKKTSSNIYNISFFMAIKVFLIYKIQHVKTAVVADIVTKILHRLEFPPVVRWKTNKVRTLSIV
jgi:hypothetical protein